MSAIIIPTSLIFRSIQFPFVEDPFQQQESGRWYLKKLINDQLFFKSQYADILPFLSPWPCSKSRFRWKSSTASFRFQLLEPKYPTTFQRPWFLSVAPSHNFCRVTHFCHPHTMSPDTCIGVVPNSFFGYPWKKPLEHTRRRCWDWPTILLGRSRLNLI